MSTASPQTAAPADHRSAPSANTSGLPAAKAPVSSTFLTVAGILGSLVIAGLGILGVQDALTRIGLLDSESWMSSVVGGLDGYRTGGWMLPVGIGIAAVGLWLLYQALRPRPSRAHALGGGVFLRNRAVARIAKDAASDVDGVTDVKSSATPRKVALNVTATATEGVEFDVREAVATRLSALERVPRIDVKVTREGS